MGRSYQQATRLLKRCLIRYHVPLDYITCFSLLPFSPIVAVQDKVEFPQKSSRTPGTTPLASPQPAMTTTTPQRLSLDPRWDEAMAQDGDEDLGRWAVVIGFTPGDYTSPIRALQRYGQVTAHKQGVSDGGGHSNFLFVQFATGMHRDQAVAIGSTFINASVVIHIMPLTPENAEKFRFRNAIVAGGRDANTRSDMLSRGGGGGAVAAESAPHGPGTLPPAAVPPGGPDLRAAAPPRELLQASHAVPLRLVGGGSSRHKRSLPFSLPLRSSRTATTMK